MATCSTIRPLMKPFALCSSSVTKVCACGWMDGVSRKRCMSQEQGTDKRSRPLFARHITFNEKAEQTMKRAKTPTFLLELPLQVDWSQEHQLHAHLEAARCLYNALRGFAMKRLGCMRNDPAWSKACAIAGSHKQERAQAFSALRKNYHFSEYE